MGERVNKSHPVIDGAQPPPWSNPLQDCMWWEQQSQWVVKSAVSGSALATAELRALLRPAMDQDNERLQCEGGGASKALPGTIGS